MSRTSAGTVAALLALLAVPWSVQVFAGDGPAFVGERATLLFAWGLFDVHSLSVTTLTEFLLVHTRGLPEYILAWPLSVLLYGLALASAVVGWRTGREDPRVTAGLLVVAAVAQFRLAWAFSAQPNRIALPLGTAALLAVAWWRYGPRAVVRTES